MNKKLLRILWMDDARIHRWGRWYVGIHLVSGTLLIAACLPLYFLFQSLVAKMESGTIRWLDHLAGHLEPGTREHQHTLEVQPVVADFSRTVMDLGIWLSLVPLALGASFLVTAVLIQRLREAISEQDRDGNAAKPPGVGRES